MAQEAKAWRSDAQSVSQRQQSSIGFPVPQASPASVLEVMLVCVDEFLLPNTFIAQRGSTSGVCPEIQDNIRGVWVEIDHNNERSFNPGAAGVDFGAARIFP